MSPLQIISLIIVLILIGVAFFVSLQSTAPALHLQALKNYLGSLQLKLASPEAISAEKERVKIEILLNKLKTSLSQQDISEDKELKDLFDETCRKIKIIATKSEGDKKSSWHQLKNVVFDFSEFYYPLYNVVVTKM